MKRDSGRQTLYLERKPSIERTILQRNWHSKTKSMGTRNNSSVTTKPSISKVSTLPRLNESQTVKLETDTTLLQPISQRNNLPISLQISRKNSDLSLVESHASGGIVPELVPDLSPERNRLNIAPKAQYKLKNLP